MINLNNWAYYYIKIGEMGHINPLKKPGTNYAPKFRRHEQILNCLSLIFALGIVALKIWNMILNIQTPTQTISNRGLIFLGSELILIGVGFIIYGILTIRVLKTHFSKFYRENIFYLILATILLSLPLIIRGLLDLLRGAWKQFDEFTYNNLVAFNMFNYLVGTILPLAFQLSSLIFGLIRKKKNEKFKLRFTEIDHDPTNQSDSDKLS